MSTSERQIKANRQNAHKSTGPKSVDGKTIVAHNAVKHGISSKILLLPHESKNEWEFLREGLFADLQPEGQLEVFLVESLAVLAWRKNRIIQAEAEAYRLRKERLKAKEDGVHFFGDDQEVIVGHDLGMAFDSELFLRLARYETTLDKAFYRTLFEIRHIQSHRRQKLAEVTALQAG